MNTISKVKIVSQSDNRAASSGKDSIYILNKGSFNVEVDTKPGFLAELRSYDESKILASSRTNSKGRAVFGISNSKERGRYEFSVLIFQDKNLIYRYKFSVIVDPNYKEVPKNSVKAVNSVEISEDFAGGESNNNIEFMFDIMDLSSVKIDIDRVLYTNQTRPALKIQSNLYKKFTINIVGFGEYLFNEPIEVGGEVSVDGAYFIFSPNMKFMLPGKYLFVIKFYDDRNLYSPMEEYFIIDIQFHNNQKLVVVEEGNFLYVEGAKSGSKIILSILREGNILELVEIFDQEEGKQIAIDKTKLEAMHQQFVVQSLDLHKNLSKAYHLP